MITKRDKPLSLQISQYLKFLPFALKANVWISDSLLFTEPGMCWQQFVFSANFCFQSWPASCAFVWVRAHTVAGVSRDPRLLSADSPLVVLFISRRCVFVPYAYAWANTHTHTRTHTHIYMHTHTHAHTLMQFSLPCTCDDTFPFECYGCRLETQTHSQKWAFKVVSVCKRWRRICHSPLLKRSVSKLLEGWRIRKQFNRKSNLHSYYLLLLSWTLCVCLCVCVCVRESQTRSDSSEGCSSPLLSHLHCHTLIGLLSTHINASCLLHSSFFICTVWYSTYYCDYLFKSNNRFRLICIVKL